MAIVSDTLVLSHRFACGLSRTLARFAVDHHNRIQFVGYEVANVALVVHGSFGSATLGFASTLESAAALAMLAGSACIYRFDPSSRPSLLFVGGMSLALGGLLLTAAGYPITGLAVALASLETARGGLQVLIAHVEKRLAARRHVERRTRRLLRIAAATLGVYVRLVSRLRARRPALGRFVDERPFLVGTLIKAPLRVEFIARKLLAGDPFGAAIGLSWMVLGDGGLALNDAGLKASLRRFAER